MQRFSKVRDAARASREIIDVVDVMDVDGPMKVLEDNLIAGLTNVKRSQLDLHRVCQTEGTC